MTDGPSEASVENLQVCIFSMVWYGVLSISLQKFLDTFICQANQAGVQYFYFEVSHTVSKSL